MNKSNPLLFIIIVLLLVTVHPAVQCQVEHITVNPRMLNTCNEPAIAVNPVNPENIAIGVNNTYCFYTYNGGRSWSNVKMQSSYGVWGDPTLVFDSEGNLYFAHLSGEPPLSGRWVDRIVIQKSTDGGATWNNGSFTGLNRPKHEDKCWMSIDRDDNLYIAWTEDDQIFNSSDTCKSRILFSYSEDGAETWSEPISINDVDGDCMDGDNTTEGAIPAIGPDGEIYIAWSGPVGIVFDKSLDGGRTFGDDLFISPQIGGWAWGSEVPGVRGNGLPQTLCDTGSSEHSGNIYILWADQRNGPKNPDIFIKKSTDEGVTWSTAVRVNTDSTDRPQFFPWACIDPLTGYMYILFYDRRNTIETGTDVYLAISEDGAETFTNIKISKESFPNDPYVFTGDYINMQFMNGKLYPVWIRVDDGNRNVITSVIDINQIPTGTRERGNYSNLLNQNFPNPFNGNTTISFQVSSPNHVTLKIHDSTGREVAELVNGYKKPGEYNASFDGSGLPEGHYYITLGVGDWSATRNMVLLQ